jgi:hypothetical protein
MIKPPQELSIPAVTQPPKCRYHPPWESDLVTQNNPRTPTPYHPVGPAGTIISLHSLPSASPISMAPTPPISSPLPRYPCTPEHARVCHSHAAEAHTLKGNQPLTKGVTPLADRVASLGGVVVARALVACNEEGEGGRCSYQYMYMYHAGKQAEAVSYPLHSTGQSVKRFLLRHTPTSYRSHPSSSRYAWMWCHSGGAECSYDRIMCSVALSSVL